MKFVVPGSAFGLDERAEETLFGRVVRGEVPDAGERDDDEHDHERHDRVVEDRVGEEALPLLADVFLVALEAVALRLQPLGGH